MSILVAMKVLEQLLKKCNFPAHVCSILVPTTICQLFLICPSDKRGVAREQIDPKTQGPTNVSKILKDLLDLSQKTFVFLSEMMKPTYIQKVRVGKELRVFNNVK